MEDIRDVSIEPLIKSNFLKTLRMNFTQNGIQRYWDLIQWHDDVCCVLFNTSWNVLVLVKQFRPKVYFNAGIQTSPNKSPEDVDWSKVPGKSGITIELCAGIVDCDLPLNEIIKKEVLEECGYDVPLANFQEIVNSWTGNSSTVFYAECTDTMRVSEGGGLPEEGEIIEVIEMNISEIREYMSRPCVVSPLSFLFGITWFLANKC